MKLITPSAVEASIKAPPSKSLTQRALIAAALAKGRSEIVNPSACDDAVATINVIKALGADVVQKENTAEITGGGEPGNDVLDCGESGTCMRMITPVAALYDRQFMITARGSLTTRPVGMMEYPLTKLGADISSENGHPPITLHGPIKGGNIEINGTTTSQFLSGLLMALPLCKKDSRIRVFNLKSKYYVTMTQKVLSEFGVQTEADEDLDHFRVDGNQAYKPLRYEVKGDWSGAAFMLVAGAISGSIEVQDLQKDSTQPDKAILDALQKAGADVAVNDSIKVRKSELNAFEFDATHCPDLFPPLAVLACNCRGNTVLHGAERLKHKESDRRKVLVKELGSLGAKIKLDGDRMEITGGKLKGGRMDPHNDHRIAMAGAIAALNSENGVEISHEECVSKSYPGFFKDLESITVK